MDVDKDESVLESFRKLLSTSIALCGVLSRKDSKVGMSFDDFLSLNDQKFSVII